MSSASDRITGTPSAARRRPSRAISTGAQPGGARALDVGLRRVADVPRVAGVRRRAPARARRCAVGLGRADLGGGERAVEQRRQPGLGQPLVQRAVPVGDDDERMPGARAARAAPGAASG